MVSRCRCSPYILWYWHTSRALCLVDDKDAVQTSDAGDGTKGVKHELLIGFHVAGVDLDEEVEVATGVVALRDLIDVLHGIHKLLDEGLSMLLETDVTEHEDAVANFLRVDNRHIALDVSEALKALLSLEGGRGREMDTRSEFLDRHARVFLKELKDATVGVVKCLSVCHSCIL